MKRKQSKIRMNEKTILEVMLESAQDIQMPNEFIQKIEGFILQEREEATQENKKKKKK